MPLTLLDLTEAKSRIVASADVSTLSNPSPQLIEAFMGIPTSSGITVTKERAYRCASFLGAVVRLADDIAKMPLCLEEITQVKGPRVTREAIDNRLYSLLKYAPNPWMTSYQMTWINTFNLVTNSNFFVQKLEDGLGIKQLMPLNPWCMKPRWDLTDKKNPQRFWDYDENGVKRSFKNDEIWTCSRLAFNGIDGQAIIALAKDALALMIASDETAGRFFANGLGITGFFTTPADMVVDEVKAQQFHDDMKRNYTGSGKAGRAPMLPGGWKYEKVALTAVEGQLLESRKWNAEEIARLLGGQPLVTKLGYGEKNNTYNSSAAFLEDYFKTSLMPLTVNMEQSIVRDLIATEDRGRLIVAFDEYEITRGAPKERAEIDEINIRCGKKSPQECRLADGLDETEGADYLHVNQNCILKDGELITVGVRGVGNQEEPTAPGQVTEPPPTPGAKTPSARLQALAEAAAERVALKETKGGKIDAKFISQVMSISVSKAKAYLAKRKSGEITDSDVKQALIVLAMNEEGDQNA